MLTLKQLLEGVHDGEPLEIISEQYHEYAWLYHDKNDINEGAMDKEVTDIFAANRYDDDGGWELGLFEPILCVVLGKEEEDDS